MTDGLNPYETYLHEKQLWLDRQERRREKEKQKHKAPTNGKVLTSSSWWTRVRDHEVEPDDVFVGKRAVR